MLKRVLQPQRFFKMGAAAAAIGLIAVLAIASPANASRTDLKTLVDRQLGSTNGPLIFFNYSFNDSESTVDPANIIITDIDDPVQPGIKVEPINGEMLGDEKLVFGFRVQGPNIRGALLNLTYGNQVPSTCEGATIDLDLIDDSFDPGLELEVNYVSNRGTENLDVGFLPDPVELLVIDTSAVTAVNACDSVELLSYEIRVLSVDISPSFEVAYVSQTAGCDGNSPCYTSVQDAVDGVVSFTEIRITSDDYGAVSLSDPKVLILSGGWTSDYSAQSGETTVNSLEINDGSFYDTQFIAMDGLGP